MSGIGDGRHGFDIALARGLLPEGRHVLHLRCAETGAPVPGSPIVIEGPTGMATAITEAAATDEDTRRSDPDLNGASRSSSRRFASTGRPIPRRSSAQCCCGRRDAVGEFPGHLDEVSDTEISGWIMQRDEPSHRCVVALREDERVLARTVASRFRPDLAAAGVGDGCYAFNLAMPRSLLDGQEHLLEIIEQDTGFSLTAEPVLWRSAAGTGGAALTGLHSELAIAGPDGAARLLDTEARQFPSTAGRLTATVVRWRTRRPSPRQNRPPPSCRNPRPLRHIRSRLLHRATSQSDWHPARPIEHCAVGRRWWDAPAIRRQLPVFNARTRRWMVIPTSYLVSLLKDLFLPEEQRPVSFATDEVRDGILPGATDFNGAGLLDDGNPSVLCLLGAAWVQRDYRIA
jgi:hypothetical protein